MHAHRRRTTTSLGLLAVVFVICAVSTIDRIPAVGELQAQTTWRGLVVAPEQRCSPYDAGDYRYPQSVEDRIVAELGGVYGPYTGRWFASKSDTDIEHMIARSEAHDSGLCAADLAMRRRFATDLLNLTLAAPRVNRYEKVDRDPRSRGDRRVGRQPERPRQLRGGSSARDRTGDARPSRVPVHAGR